MTIKDVEISDKVADRMDQSRVAMHIIFDTLIAEIKCQLRKGNTVQIEDFGEFEPDFMNEKAYFYIDPHFEEELSETLPPEEE